MQTRRVEQQDLPGRPRNDAEDAMPCRLRLRTRNAQTLTNQRVQQSRLANVWPADHGDGSAAVVTV
jgi:hypothetical protein